MTMGCNLRSSLSTRNFQPGVRFGSAFSRSGLDAAGSIGDAQLSNQREQDLDRGILMAAQPARDPLAPQLYGVLEAQGARMHGGLHCGLRHQQADQVIGEEMHPELL